MREGIWLRCMGIEWTEYVTYLLLLRLKARLGHYLHKPQLQDTISNQCFAPDRI